MLNILVPTDFSDLSKIAVQYAIKVANQFNGTITLLHVVPISQTVRVSRREQIKDLEEDLFAFAERDLQKLMKEVSYDLQTSDPIQWAVVRGASVKDAIRKEAKRLRTGLIVMGTRGASGIKKAVVGSNTASMIEVSDVPVMAVPEHAQFRGFRDIVYASDLRFLEHELQTLMPYAQKFESTVHLVHVEPPGCDIEAIEEQIDTVIQKLGLKSIVNLVLVDNFIEGAIDQYIGVSKADLLTMFTHRLTFYEKLFDKSHTRNMAFHSSVPVLAFKREKK